MTTSLPLHLDNGLILRRSTPADAERLSEFNGRIHSETDARDRGVTAWTRGLLERPHPTFHGDDFTIVEDTNTGQIVSSLNLISQTWTYAGIPFGVGRPELVGTDPAYRNRGLVRMQFDLAHQWSAERGERVQAITGIPYYYRLFGYEMAVNLDGGRAGYKPHIPSLPEGQSEPYLIRPAVEADLPVLAELYRQGCRRSLLACERDEALWRYELLGRNPEDANRVELCAITTPDGQVVGLLTHPWYRWGAMMVAKAYELRPDVPWTAVTPTVIRYLRTCGETHADYMGGDVKFESFGFWLGAEHPVYQVLSTSLPRSRRPYAWYLRVPDLPGFVQHIAPALEARLAASIYAGYSGETKITFYRSGLRLALENGRLTTVALYRPEPVGHTGDAAFPGLTFLQLLFGYRSLDELKYAFPDCWCSNETQEGLLKALFPPQVSEIWPVS